MSSETSLSVLHLTLLNWSNPLDVLDDLCRCCLTIRGGELLNQLILLEENESNARKKELYRYFWSLYLK